MGDEPLSAMVESLEVTLLPHVRPESSQDVVASALAMLSSGEVDAASASSADVEEGDGASVGPSNSAQ